MKLFLFSTILLIVKTFLCEEVIYESEMKEQCRRMYEDEPILNLDARQDNQLSKTECALKCLDKGCCYFLAENDNSGSHNLKKCVIYYLQSRLYKPLRESIFQRVFQTPDFPNPDPPPQTVPQPETVPPPPASTSQLTTPVSTAAETTIPTTTKKQANCVYTFFEFNLNWEAAKEICETHEIAKTTLSMLRSNTDLEIMETLLNKQYSEGTSRRFWVGAFYGTPPNVANPDWYWIDNSLLQKDLFSITFDQNVDSRLGFTFENKILAFHIWNKAETRDFPCYCPNN